MYRLSGVLPQWELAGNNTATMIGYHTHSVILDGYRKGIRGFDEQLAFEAMKKRVQDIGYYKDLGYIPADKEGGSVSMVMEYAYNDWSVAQMAKELGKEQKKHPGIVEISTEEYSAAVDVFCEGWNAANHATQYKQKEAK